MLTNQSSNKTTKPVKNLDASSNQKYKDDSLETKNTKINDEKRLDNDMDINSTSSNVENNTVITDNDKVNEAIDIVKNKYNAKVDDNSTFKTDLGIVTIDYDGQDSDNNYIIAVRRNSDTSIIVFCHVNPSTGEIIEDFQPRL